MPVATIISSTTQRFLALHSSPRCIPLFSSTLSNDFFSVIECAQITPLKASMTNIATASRCTHQVTAVTLPRSTIFFNNTQRSPLHPLPLQIVRSMAGHNKWSKIKRKKAANDIARHRDHTRATRAIETASRACRGDMGDIHLQSSISAARQVQLPKDRIERAIERGANPNSKSEGEEYVVRRYDGMIPAGSNGKVAVIIETLTENKNRTAANVRNMLKKAGGELLPTGTNDWMFDHVGIIWIAKQSTKDGCNIDKELHVDETALDALIDCALEGGAIDVEFLSHAADINSEVGLDEDVNISQHYAMVKCEPNDVLQLIQLLQKNGHAVSQFEKLWMMKDESNRVDLDTEGSERFEKFLDLMDDDLDVTNVFHSASFSE